MANMMLTQCLFCLLVIQGTFELVSGANVANIIGGKVPDRQEAGWSVTLYVPGGVRCGATLLNRRWVLTLASCVQYINPNDIFIIMGSHNINTDFDNMDVKYGVETVTFPNYNFTVEHNIALLKMKGVAKVGNRFINLVDDIATPEIFDAIREKDRRCYVYGTGIKVDEDGIFVENYQMKKISTRYINCKNEFALGFEQLSGLDCIKTNERSDRICNDGGQAIVCRFQGKWYQTGMISVYSTRNGCRSAFNGVTNISGYIAWILATIN